MAEPNVPMTLRARIFDFVQRSGVFAKPTMHLPGTAFAERALSGHINPDHHTVSSDAVGIQAKPWPKFPSGRVK